MMIPSALAVLLILTVIKKAQCAIGLIVVPGLGRKDRLETVVNNLKHLEDSIMSRRWDCVVYTYGAREYTSGDKQDSYFWSKANEAGLDFVRSFCTIVENQGKRVTEHLHMVQPALIKSSYKYVFVLLDDCKIESSAAFSLDGMIAVMERNKLTAASPRIINANKGGGQQFRTIMQAPPPHGGASPGYVVSFIEIFGVIMTMEGYTALWELLCPAVNPYGWGYDFWYDHYARGRVRGHKMGIISAFSLKHEQVMDDVSVTGRSDNVKVEDKWQALVLQERYYQHHYGIRLHKFRETLSLRNMSWNGAVTGFLEPARGQHQHQLPKRPLEFLDNT